VPQAFDILDKNSTGVVSQELFQATLGELGFELPEPTLPVVMRLLSSNVEGQVDLKLLVRGVLGFDDSMTSLSRVNQSSHQMLQHSQPQAPPVSQEGMEDFPLRKDANSIAQRMRAIWRQSYPMPSSAAPLRLSTAAASAGSPVRSSRRESRIKCHSDHFVGDGFVSRSHSAMELRLMEEGGDALARLPVAVTRRPLAFTPNKQKRVLSGSSFRLGDAEHVRPSFNFTTTYGTAFDPHANSSGRIF